MQKKVVLSLLAIAAASPLFLNAPSYAGEVKAAEDDAKAQEHASEAAHQRHKARRDAARGDVAGAEKHAAEAKDEAHKAHHDEHKAVRDANH